MNIETTHNYANPYRNWKVYVIRTIRGGWKVGVLDENGDAMNLGEQKDYDTRTGATEHAKTLAKWFDIEVEVVS